jgi:hypothetical protein
MGLQTRHSKSISNELTSAQRQRVVCRASSLFVLSPASLQFPPVFLNLPIPISSLAMPCIFHDVKAMLMSRINGLFRQRCSNTKLVIGI